MKKYKYKVSVCVPVYNMERYLEECIESLVAQTLKDIELVFVNDGSTDRSLEILERYAQKHRNIVIVNQENQGLGGARNKGMIAAKGEYIGFVDADDRVDQKMYEILLTAIETEKVEMAMCDLAIFPEGVKKNKWYTPYKGKIDGEFLHRNTQPWNKLVSKELISRIEFEFFEKNGDGMFILLMLHAKGIVSIDTPLYLYRAGHSSMSTDFKIDSFLVSIRSCEKQISLLGKTKYKDSLREFFEFRMIYILLQTLAVAAKLQEEGVYIKASRKLHSLNFRTNRYLAPILRKDYGTMQFLGIVYLLPFNYKVSSLLARKVL